jgi:hypothetical protein
MQVVDPKKRQELVFEPSSFARIGELLKELGQKPS